METGLDKVHHINLALRNRHSGDSWAYFEELRSRTGYSGHVGYIDAYAVGLWKENRGFIAYEVKVSRGDFKSDVAEFSTKQSVAIRNSTQFFYVCPHGLIEPSEVPEVSGLIWVDAGGAKVKKVAPIRELKDGSLDPDFIRAFMRAAAGPPAKRTIPLKYFGKDIDEEALLELAKDVGVRKDEKDIKFYARHEAAKMRLKSRQVLLKLCDTFGMPRDMLDYRKVEDIAERIDKQYRERLEQERQVNVILYNVNGIRRAVDELERVTREREQLGGEGDAAKADRKEGRGAGGSPAAQGPCVADVGGVGLLGG